jgi:serine/threonine protein kinase
MSHLLAKGQVLLERYCVKHYIAEGGMQQVFEAEDLSFNRPVALKVPKNPSAEKRFERSAQVSAKITHANVAKTLDFFEEGGRQYLVEELVVGTDLAEGLRSSFTYFDPHLGAHFVHQFARGLSAAHHAGVFHRDLKPSNVMISSDENLRTIKITDFGIAKMAARELEEAVDGGDTSITGSQTAVGTLPYMAPEMIEAPKAASKPADVWALGAILYRLLAGKEPFGTGLKAIPTILAANCPEMPTFLTSKAQFSELGIGLWKIVVATLQKNPEDRPLADEVLNMCSQLCYSDSPRFIATVGSVKAGKGRNGFLVDSKAQQFFYHEDSYYGDVPIKDTRVLAAAYPGTPRPRAFPILPLKS